MLVTHLRGNVLSLKKGLVQGRQLFTGGKEGLLGSEILRRGSL